MPASAPSSISSVYCSTRCVAVTVQCLVCFAGRHKSSMESSLTALLHMCHRLRHIKCQGWLLPHIPSVWDTFFDSFQAFCHTCEQLSMASCAAAAQPQEQQLPEGNYRQAQQRQQLRQEQAASASQSLQSVAARVAMFNAMNIATTDKTTHAMQQATGQESIVHPAGPKQEVSSRHRHQQRLLVLLTRCAEMEKLLAHLLPGFLALNADEAQQVSGNL